MPLQFFTDKNGNRKSRYVAPSTNFKKSSKRPKRLSLEDIGMETPTRPRLSDDEKEERRKAAFNRGGKFENNFFKNALPSSVSNFLYNLDERNQLNRLNQFPEQRSDRFANVQQNIRDAASNEGFNFDNLFMGANVSADRRDPNEVRDDPEGGFIDASGKVTTEDILRSRPGVSEQDILNAVGNTQFNPAVVGSLMTPAAGFSTSALGDYLTGGQGVGGLMSDNNAMFSTFPDNTATNTVNMTAPRGNFNNVPPNERSISGGLLQTPTFNFDVAPFGGTGIYDNLMLEAIQNSPFGSGITLNPNLTPSTASAGFLGVNALSPTGTINIGNLGTVTDQFGRELFGQERIDFINNEFARLQNENKALSNLGLNILR